MLTPSQHQLQNTELGTEIKYNSTWVGNHNYDAVRTVLDNLGNNELEDIHVSLHQVETTLPLLLTDACGHHDDLRIGSHRIVLKEKWGGRQALSLQHFTQTYCIGRAQTAWPRLSCRSLHDKEILCIVRFGNLIVKWTKKIQTVLNQLHQLCQDGKTCFTISNETE